MDRTYLTNMLNNDKMVASLAVTAEQYHGGMRNLMLELIEQGHPKKEYLRRQVSMLDKMHGAPPKGAVTVSADR